MPDTVLDELIFQAVPLGEKPLASPPALAVDIPVGGGPKRFSQSLPFFARRPPMISSDTNWPAFCGLLKDFGIPLQTTVAALEPLSIANVPPRFARRPLEDGFDLQELQTAEAIEISCVAASARGRHASMPLETNAWHELKQLVESLRDLCGPTMPIGLGLIGGDIHTDIANALAAGVDFVILELPAHSSEQLTPSDLRFLAWCVAGARIACSQSVAPDFPIYVDAPLTSVEDLIKLLALGASAVTIDGLAWSDLPRSSSAALSVPKGLLSVVGSVPVKATPNVEPLQRRLTELLESLKTRMVQQHVSHLRQLTRDHLRALSDQTARLCNVRMLDHM